MSNAGDASSNINARYSYVQATPSLRYLSLERDGYEITAIDGVAVAGGTVSVEITPSYETQTGSSTTTTNGSKTNIGSFVMGQTFKWTNNSEILMIEYTATTTYGSQILFDDSGNLLETESGNLLNTFVRELDSSTTITKSKVYTGISAFAITFKQGSTTVSKSSGASIL